MKTHHILVPHATVVQETGWETVGWIHLAQYMDKWEALVNTILNLRVP
jgi:hypothetical protein